MAYDNYSDRTTIIYHKAGTGATIDYSSLQLNSSIDDLSQILVIRKFTPSSTFKTTAAPNGFGGVFPDGQEWWDIWTLDDPANNGSKMYTINTSEKKITMSTNPTDYYWTRTNADGTTSQVYLPVFNANTDDVIILRKTYALDNFVNWMSGTRVTSKNLNLNADQILFLLQEMVTNFRREDLVNPFVGAASGVCPLDSSGFIPAANVGATSLAEALAGITFTAGDGLSGGGTLAANRTFAIDLDDTLDNGLSIINNKLGIGLGTSLAKDGNLVDVRLAGGSGLKNESGLKADAFTTLSAVTTSTTKLVTSSVIKELKDDVDSLGTGVRFLGGITPAAQASATFTFGNTEFDDHADETITIIDTAGTSKTYKIKASGADASSQEFNDGADATEAATNFCALVNSSNGHNGTITATNIAGAVTLVQATGGTDGNRTIAHTSNWDAICDVNPPATFLGGDNGVDPGTAPAGGYKAGDTFDVITNGTTTSTWTDSSWDTLVALTQGHDVRYNGSSWESIPPVATVDLSGYVRKDGTTTMTGSLNLGSNSLTNVVDAANNTTDELQNATSKNFVLNKAFALTPLDSMKDVADYTTPTAKSILVWNFADTDNNWKTKTLATISVGELDDITVSGASDGDVLSWDGSNFVPSSAYGNPQVWSSRAGSITGGSNSGYGDGTTTAFTLNTKPSSTNASSFIVALDGVLQVPGQDFVSITSATSSGVINFATGSAPPYGAEISIYNTGKLTNLPPSGYVSTDPTSVPLTITGHASQSANLTEWKSSGGTVLAAVDKDGAFVSGAQTTKQVRQFITSTLNLHADMPTGRNTITRRKNDTNPSSPPATPSYEIEDNDDITAVPYDVGSGNVPLIERTLRTLPIQVVMGVGGVNSKPKAGSILEIEGIYSGYMQHSYWWNTSLPYTLELFLWAGTVKDIPQGTFCGNQNDGTGNILNTDTPGRFLTRRVHQNQETVARRESDGAGSNLNSYYNQFIHFPFKETYTVTADDEANGLVITLCYRWYTHGYQADKRSDTIIANPGSDLHESIGATDFEINNISMRPITMFTVKEIG